MTDLWDCAVRGLIDALAVLLKAGIIDENGTILSGQELPIPFRSYVFEVEAEEAAQSTESSLAVHIAPGVYITQEGYQEAAACEGRDSRRNRSIV